MNTKLGKPGKLGFITTDIAFMIAGDKIDVLLDLTQRTDVFELEITAVEQVPTDEQRIKFFSLSCSQIFCRCDGGFDPTCTSLMKASLNGLLMLSDEERYAA